MNNNETHTTEVRALTASELDMVAGGKVNSNSTLAELGRGCVNAALSAEIAGEYPSKTLHR
jgi:hypothetical protein